MKNGGIWHLNLERPKAIIANRHQTTIKYRITVFEISSPAIAPFPRSVTVKVAVALMNRTLDIPFQRAAHELHYIHPEFTPDINKLLAIPLGFVRPIRCADEMDSLADDKAAQTRRPISALEDCSNRFDVG